MVAGPLLLAPVSDDPALIAGGAFAAHLPWLLFALVSGAFVDRLDRRRLIVVVNPAFAMVAVFAATWRPLSAATPAPVRPTSP